MIILEKEDRLVEQQSRHDNSQHYSSVTEWVILSKDGQRKGRVSCLTTSPPAAPRATASALPQFDNAGKVVVDKLTDAAVNSPDSRPDGENIHTQN